MSGFHCLPKMLFKGNPIALEPNSNLLEKEISSTE
uniref:Uncharacterized protein n=1 Tax=Anguilla anguilla TaxID=7936 RepID=A0A0E9W4I5_ANGAN